MDNKKVEEQKTISEILSGGARWQHELSVVLVDLCKRVEKLEIGSLSK